MRVVLVFSLLCTAITASAEEYDPLQKMLELFAGRKAAAQVQPAVVQLNVTSDAGDGTGSGFVISDGRHTVVLDPYLTRPGLPPMFLGTGDADTSFRSPMAIAVIGGLMTSTFLSLLVIPVVYTLMDDFEHGLKHLFLNMKKLGVRKA